jgi:hypothetical protein
MNGQELAEKVEQQISEMGKFLSGLTESDLSLPCHDDDRAGTTVGTVASHVVGGFSQASMFLRISQAGGIPKNFANSNHVQAHTQGTGGPDPSDPQKMAKTLERDGATLVKVLSQMSDEQLAVVPPKIGNIANGKETLAEVVANTLHHQAEHMVRLREAVLAGEHS